MISLNDRITADGITLTYSAIGPADYGRTEYAVTLYHPAGHHFTLPDYLDSDEPTALQVIYLLLMIADRANENTTYEAWASDHELDPEKWQDRDTYRRQRLLTERLTTFLGSFAVNLTLNKDRSSPLYTALEIAANTLGWCLFALIADARGSTVTPYLWLALALFINLPLASTYQRVKDRARDAQVKAPANAEEAVAKEQETE